MNRQGVSASGLCSVLLAVVVLALGSCESRDTQPAGITVGDLHAIHAEVRAANREIRGQARVADDEPISTGPDGRARLRLDDGTLVVIDTKTSFAVRGKNLKLTAGRLFVQGGQHASLTVNLGNASTTVASSSAAFEHRGKASSIYCAQGELVVTRTGQQTRVSSGETATLEAQKVRVAPEKAFDDWTGGLAVPWSGEGDGASAIAELRGVSGNTDPGVALVVSSHEIKTEIEGEVAVTRSRTVYFNGSEAPRRADVRVAIAPGAILSRVARRIGSSVSEADLRIGRAEAASKTDISEWPRLEWVGSGRLSGSLGQVSSGDSIELILEYAEWLPTRGGRTTYRVPLANDTNPALVGDLKAHIDVSRTHSPWVTGSAGMVEREGVLELRRADARSTGDLVVEMAPAIVDPHVARAYVVQGPRGEDPYVMVRTEVPERKDPGVTLAVVLDTSMSVGASTLETERSLLDALLNGLGPRDSIVVFAADQRVAPVGPKEPRPVTPELRAEIRRQAARLRPGGASDLGTALQFAGDVLDAPSRGQAAGSGMVVYLGDGRMTVGDPNAESIRRRLRRRASGMPRLGAVAVGPGANRWELARLVAGAGGVYEVADRSDAARIGATLLADALEPTLRDVHIDLGTTVDRIYPREAQTALAGATVTVVGRIRGKLPTRVTFRFRDGSRIVEETRALRRVNPPPGAGVPERWAAARIEEMAARGDSLEPAIALAERAHLLTPWTGWYFDSQGSTTGQPLKRRVFELSPALDAPFAPHVEGAAPTASTLLEPPGPSPESGSLAKAAEVALRRILDDARSAVRACRDARAAVRPEVASVFDIELQVNAEGRATRVRISAGAGAARDRVLERCIEGVVKSLPLFAAGAAVTVTHRLTVPEGRGSRRTVCSPASKLSLPIRRALWMARPDLDAAMYIDTARKCELVTWRDRRELLLLMADRIDDAVGCLRLSTDLDQAGETDAAGFLRKEALRRIKTFSELEALSRIVVGAEPNVDRELEKAYAAAATNEARLDVVRRFLRLAPHSALARRRLFMLLEALGRKDALVTEIEHVRADPFADAGLLAEGAAALGRLGRQDESRRAFGELIERAPADPWTLAFVGDRLRSEGLFDEAVKAYESLERVIPLDAAVALRLGLAHAGAERLDVATRLLRRVTEAGLREDDGRLGELASIVEAVLLADARDASNPPRVNAELTRRLAETPLPDVASVVVVQAPSASDPLEVKVARERGDKEPIGADFDARALGLSAVRIERGDGAARILIQRKADPGPSRAILATVRALVLTGERAASRLVTREVRVLADGKPVELRWNGETFL